MPLMCYLFIILFFRILAYENIGKKILTTGPRLLSRGLPDLSATLLFVFDQIVSYAISNLTLYTTLTNFSAKYLVMCNVYTDVDGIK